MKLFNWLKDNLLFVITLFLLVFIPLYPKRPLLDIQHTWVYVRVEDFIVAFAVLVWVILLVRKKITLKTPLTIPIFIFWIIGGIATLHGVLLIFPEIPDVFSNVAFLSFMRRIEYIFLFFVAFSAMRSKKYISIVAVTLAFVLLGVVGYGFGQKFFGFPAFLTMNEEFAKGIPIQLSQLSRVPSTFAGHYDLAAYLVLIIPLLISMAFGFRNWIVKIFFLCSAALGFGLLFMTVSRVSFIVLLLALVALLLMQKKKWVIASFFVFFVVTIAFLVFSPSLLQRFGNTVSEVDVLVNAKTGEALGHIKLVPASYFDNKIIYKEFISGQEKRESSGSAAVLPNFLIPPQATLLIESNAPTGENLPQGTGYVNLPLSPVVKKVDQYYFEKPVEGSSEAVNSRVIFGDFLVKRAVAYDLSFTTRFQGEWPRTIDAFKRNIFLGSGYGAVSLAVDNNYLRILGESGLLGFSAFLGIFLIAGIYIKKILPSVESPVERSFVIGFVAGAFGLMLNAVLIDVFEASKIAFTFWILMGITLGSLSLYKDSDVDLYRQFKKIAGSTPAVVIYLLVLTVAVFYSTMNYYFVGDDFTWFRWISDCSINGNALGKCDSVLSTILNYFTHADGFFYRPGAKLYFYFMYSAFWLNQTMYHLVSISLHFLVAVLVFLVSKRVLKDYFLSAMCAILFLIVSGHHEAIFWISSTGFLFNAVCVLLSLLCFMYWKERKRKIYLLLSVLFVTLSLLFHELGVVAPLLIILYDLVFGEKVNLQKMSKKAYYLLLLSPLVPYLGLRLFAKSHWFSGDYSYNLLKLPYNVIGNAIGYFMLTVLGPISLPLYESLRNFSKVHVIFAILAALLLVAFLVLLWRTRYKKLSEDEKRIIIFGSLFFLVALLPFLGLGNITSRYSYLASFGAILCLVFLLKKVYTYLLFYGKQIAGAIMVIVVIVISMLHLFQLQKLHIEWEEAGEKSRTFLVSLSEFYIDDWATEPLKLYFVDVPIRNGDAWVFPVGLNDAVWFAFRNENIQVYQVSSLESAFNQSTGALNERIFQFDRYGNVLERKKPPPTTLLK